MVNDVVGIMLIMYYQLQFCLKVLMTIMSMYQFAQQWLGNQ